MIRRLMLALAILITAAGPVMPGVGVAAIALMASQAIATIIATTSISLSACTLCTRSTRTAGGRRNTRRASSTWTGTATPPPCPRWSRAGGCAGTEGAASVLKRQQR
jgi:hypothetical protein